MTAQSSRQLVESRTSGAFERRYTLKEASEEFFQRKVSPATMRLLRDKGKLRMERIGRTDFVTESALVAMCAACELSVPGQQPNMELAQCHAAESPHDSTPESVLVDRQSGSFSTERMRLAREQVLTTLKRLTAPSKAISRKRIGRQVIQIDQVNSSSRK